MPLKIRHFIPVLALALLGASAAHAGDTDALWKIVHGKCVPDQQAKQDPAPCAHVDLTAGEAGGYAVLKDLVGASQFLLIPTAKIEGMESPAILDAATPNYFAAAWTARSDVEAALHRQLPRDAIGLAINSKSARSQNQLHIHVDCLRPDVIKALHRHAGEVGQTWSKFAEPLAGHDYLARRLAEAELKTQSPFRLLASEVPEAAADMADQTLVVAGTTFPDGQAGFILLDDHVRFLAADFGHGEDLLDHDCAVAK